MIIQKLHSIRRTKQDILDKIQNLDATEEVWNLIHEERNEIGKAKSLLEDILCEEVIF